VRGGGPGTRESDLLSPAAAVNGVHAVLLAGGSAFGLAAADGVVTYLSEQGIGLPTRAGLVPLVAGAVVYDLGLGSPAARPTADAGYAAAAAAAGSSPDRGCVGAGTGCTVGKLLGSGAWTKGGLGHSSSVVPGGAVVAAVAVANAFGEVIAEDGTILAGVWQGDGYRRTVDLLLQGESPARSWREATTLVCVLTNARLTKTQAWGVARAANAGVARAVDPAATEVDGDVAYCVASGEVVADALVVSAIAADVTARAIRDAVRAATGAPGCPALSERAS
jgi:L-aminopeptidase/D-esterase-like protein